MEGALKLVLVSLRAPSLLGIGRSKLDGIPPTLLATADEVIE